MAGAGSPIAAIQTMSLVAPGGQFARVIENSPSFAGLAATTSPVNASGEVDKTFGVLGKLNVGTSGAVVQGKADYETFFNVFQATIDGVDPIVHASSAALAGTKTLVIEMVVDGNTQVIDGTSINTADQTVPNSADTGATWQAANPSPLAGTEPLMTQLDVETFTSTADPAVATTPTTGAGVTPTLGMRLKKGTHTSILAPDDGVDDDGDTAAEDTVEKETYDNTAAAQEAIIGGLVSFITNLGASISVDNSADVIATP
jgi:hypothetical protein